jgi:hypothetical protein
MNHDRLAKRKKIAPEPPHILAIGRLIGYKPRFSRYSTKNMGGVLDIVREEGVSVYGIIYGIKKHFLELIDSAEGAPFYYRQIIVNVKIDQIINDVLFISELSNKKYLECYSYEVVDKSPREFPPSKEYMDHVRIGKDQFGVNIELIEEIISRIGYSENS